ncbi:DHA2 family efflux MFS transporter permease subunit (plasmid) [Lichenicola cladoniae]|uniref:DHA2 family efflux MFS transporter permease subunit n=1 Tax=Lichenicola cladoniae TaxID=1484109 RepID=A0A6M8HZG7_9PROT|nr:DHA2 family efflux MFS transporter permease subunit [Lichenicola cladoniae]NPD66642.1 DHA2 family efflux MFS transporter permease subunit [Acetobacteraceae bacterium]QKE93750.1 DHA2 family efflux MFS transporter permease subunit [Lichenicola cladoniae]
MSDPRGWTPRANPWLVAVVVTLGAFMEVLDTTIVNVALPHIAGSLSVSNDDATWSLTTYLVANGIVLTISGALSRRFGRKRYFLISIGGFTAMSLACGLSTNFGELLLFRAAQGFFGGGLQPTQQALLLDYFPPAKRQQAFSIAAVAIIVAPAVGPVLGGYLTDTYSWHWIFLINVPLGVITLFAVVALVEDSPMAKKDKATAPAIDYVGIGFIVIALGCLEIAFDRAENFDWLNSTFIRVMMALSSVAFAFGIPYLLYRRHPIVNLRAFKDRNFAIAWFQIALMGFVLYASAVLVPQYAQQQAGYNATLAGLLLAPGAVLLIILIPIVSKVMNFVPVKYVIAFGGVALSSALFFSMNLVPGLDFFHLCLYRAGQSGGLAFLFVPISTIAYATLPRELNNDAAALFSMARNVVGGFGISISTSWVTDHQQTRQAHLIDHLSPGNQPYDVLLQQVQQGLINLGDSTQQAMQAAPGQIYQMLQTQSAVLAYTDVFLLTGCAALLFIPTALMLSSAKPKASGGGH